MFLLKQGQPVLQLLSVLQILLSDPPVLLLDGFLAIFGGE